MNQETTAATREYDNSVLAFRVAGYYGDDAYPLKMIGVKTGFVTEKQAYAMADVFRGVGILNNVHVQIRIQGEDWQPHEGKITRCLMCGVRLVGKEGESATYCPEHAGLHDAEFWRKPVSITSRSTLAEIAQ